MGRKFKVGDVCRIRQWNDMAMEYGVCEVKDPVSGSLLYDYIPRMPRFPRQMKHLCGKIFTIKDISGGIYYSEEGIECGWTIAAYMLEYAYPEPKTDEDFDFTLNIADLLG